LAHGYTTDGIRAQLLGSCDGAVPQIAFLCLVHADAVQLPHHCLKNPSRPLRLFSIRIKHKSCC